MWVEFVSSFLQISQVGLFPIAYIDLHFILLGSDLDLEKEQGFFFVVFSESPGTCFGPLGIYTVLEFILK